MTARRKLPPFAKTLSEARARGLIPRRLGGVHVAIALDWREVRTGGVHRIVLPGNPAGFDLRCLAGLDVRVVHATHDASRVPAVVDAILEAGAITVEAVNFDLIDSGAPRDAWLTVYEREVLRHAA